MDVGVSSFMLIPVMVNKVGMAWHVLRELLHTKKCLLAPQSKEGWFGGRRGGGVLVRGSQFLCLCPWQGS